MDKSTERKNRKKHRGKKSFIVFLVCAFFLVIAINLILSYNNRLETMIVRTGTEEDCIDAEGYVFRDQTVIYAPDGGYVYCEADEDQRVKSGETVMYIYKNQINAAANSELREIESEIRRLSNSSVKDDIYSQDTAKIEQSIAKCLHDIPRLGYEGNLGRIEEIKAEANALIENRRIILGEIPPKDNSKQLEELKGRKTELERTYNIERTAVHAPASGAFTARIDGMENVLTTEALKDVSVDSLRELGNHTIQNSVAGQVDNGALVGKIVNNFNWSVAAIVPTVRVEDVLEGDNVGIRFTDISAESIDGKVTKIKHGTDGNSVIVIESESYVETVYSTSKAKIQIVKERYEGFRVPAKSIRMSEDKTGVYIIRNNLARFVPVDILYNNQEWVIIAEPVESSQKTIKLYDELIISGKELYNGKVVR